MLVPKEDKVNLRKKTDAFLLMKLFAINFLNFAKRYSMHNGNFDDSKKFLRHLQFFLIQRHKKEDVLLVIDVIKTHLRETGDTFSFEIFENIISMDLEDYLRKYE